MKFAINSIHIALTFGALYFAHEINLPYWWLIVALLVPSAISLSTNTDQISTAVVGRLLMPISFGLLSVIFFHHFPTFINDGQFADLARLGVSNPGDSFITKASVQVSNTFVNAITVLYAITVAFLLIKGLNDLDELKSILHDEAHHIDSIATYSSFFLQNSNDESNRKVVHNYISLLINYIENITRDRRVTISEANENILSECLFCVGKLEPRDHNDEIALAEIIKTIKNLSHTRTKRIISVEKKMSPYLLTIVFFMSMAMVASFFSSATGKISVEYLYVFLLPFFYSAIFMTLLDLSSPFDGYWSIKLQAINYTKNKLNMICESNEMEKTTHPSSTH